ncbi:PIG-L family deacetylase [Arthrobacter sp. UYEF3]|uniref:PIG-L family deacetylase n=1 Tax=Arthrobacter sp. UYEF3 TaxID=1756365 RepID=UPI00339680BE
MVASPKHSVALVTAHPDDDAYGLAGSVALHARNPEFRFILILATDGGAGEVAPVVDVPAGTLGAFRRREDEAAWRSHGRPPDRHEWFGYRDGGVADVPFGELTGRIALILREERPRVLCVLLARTESRGTRITSPWAGQQMRPSIWSAARAGRGWNGYSTVLPAGASDPAARHYG